MAQPGAAPQRASTGTTVGRPVIQQPPSLGRSMAMLAILIVLIALLLYVMRGGSLPSVSTASSGALPTPALPVRADDGVLRPALAEPATAVSPAGPAQQLQPVIATDNQANVLDQQIWDVMPVTPTMSWPSGPNMWQPLPADRDYIVAQVNDHDQWMVSVWRGPTYIPTGDAVGVHYWEMPQGTSAEEVIKQRDALTQVLREQGRLRQFRPAQQQP